MNLASISRAMVKSVCVVGAGPSGLITAKTLLHNSPPNSFTVSLYDSQHAIGGLWPVSRTDNGRAVHPLMVANQSKHTMLFSEMGWEPEAPQFPRAWMVGRYLERYCERFLKGRPDFELGLGRTVTRAERVGEGWVVEVGGERREFDCLVVASGYFGKPIVPLCFDDDDDNAASSASASVPVVHSSRYRDLEGLLEKSPRKGGKILVVGGQISGVEIAGTIATHLSSAIHSPGPSTLPNAEKYSIHHVIQRPTWIAPRYTTPEPKSAAPPFLPVDLVTWDLGKREGVLKNTAGYISEEAAAMLHDKFEAAVGEQAEFCALLQPTEKERLQPPHLAASDCYAEFVRAGVITLSRGSVAAFHSQDGIATLSRGGSKIDDIAAVVLATGFDPSPCISFLPEEVLTTLHHAPEFTSQSLALAFHGSHHPNVSNLGFVGFYRGPFWGVMQMQARLLAKLWSEGPSERMLQALAADDSIERTLSLRGSPRLSQFPQGDYLFLMQDYAAALEIPLQPIPPSPELENNNNNPLDSVTPARYISPYDDDKAKQEASASLKQVRDITVQGLTTPRFVAGAVFRNLLGRWRLSRRLTSRLASQPSGTFTGTAEFHLRSQTPDGMQCVANNNDHDTKGFESRDSLEYLYIESGEFKTESGFGFQATRRYIWRYDEGRDVMSVWFARTDDDKRADYLFHEVEFLPRAADADAEARAEQGWKAKAGHLCVEDYYDVKYGFWFRAVTLKRWGIEYTVRGPRKDYTIDGSYERI